MINLFNSNANANSKVQVFYPNGSSTNQFQVWNKPHDAKLVFIYCMGAGGGGGGGRASGVNTALGGGGGASAGITRGFFPASILPEQLYVQVATGSLGGAGGVSSANGSAGAGGGISYVYVQPSGSADNVLMQSSTSEAGGGGGGQGTVTATGGTAPTLWNYTTAVYSQLGNITSSVGNSGANGDALGGSAQTTISIGTAGGVMPNIIGNVTPGAGGGSGQSGATATPGGYISNYTGASPPTVLPFFFTVQSGSAENAGAGRHGSPGHAYGPPSQPNVPRRNPVFFPGGAGGGGQDTNVAVSVAGAGGNAAYGSGGGGGAGNYNGSGGRGGDGGGGLVVIVSS